MIDCAPPDIGGESVNGVSQSGMSSDSDNTLLGDLEGETGLACTWDGVSDTEGALSPLNTGWVVCGRTVLKAVVGKGKLGVEGCKMTSKEEEVDPFGISLGLSNGATVIEISPYLSESVTGRGTSSTSVTSVTSTEANVMLIPGVTLVLVDSVKVLSLSSDSEDTIITLSSGLSMRVSVLVVMIGVMVGWLVYITVGSSVYATGI